ncbi:MAG: DUF4199 domain-containing protein [Bacteroidota bacterium]
MIQHSIGLRYGLIAGLATIAYFLLFYQIDPKLMLGPLVYRSSLLIYLVLMFLAVFKARKEAGGGIELKAALRVAFVTYLIANLLFYGFYYLLFNYFDPELVTLQEEMMKAFLADLDQQDAQELGERLNQDELQLTFSKTFFSFIKDAIPGFILSFIIAGIARNK